VSKPISVVKFVETVEELLARGGGANEAGGSEPGAAPIDPDR
jgi:hypothetical protein